MNQEIALQIAAQLGVLIVGGAAVYGAIRADLQHAVKAAEEAHRRIDAMLIQARGRG